MAKGRFSTFIRQAADLPISILLDVYEAALRTKDVVRLALAYATGTRRKIIRVAPAAGDRYALVASFGRRKLPASLERVIPALKARGLNVVLCHNGPLDAEALERLRPHLHAVIKRPNLGRDFGAYCDGVRYLQRLKAPPKRVLFVNDSVFFLPQGLDKLIADLDDDRHAYIGLTENYQYHYHVGSFLWSINDTVFTSRAFRAFWNQYFPFSTRRYSIDCGEVRVTRYLMKKGGFVPHILYSMHEAGERLLNWSIDDVKENFHLLPLHARHLAFQFGFEQVFVDPLQVRGGGPRNDGALSRDLTASREIYAADYVRELVKFIEAGNQAHLGCGIFAKYLGMPAIKKDVVYRDNYHATDVITMMQDLGYPDLDEVALEIRRRGYPVIQGMLRRLLYVRGVI